MGYSDGPHFLMWQSHCDGDLFLSVWPIVSHDMYAQPH